MDSTDSLELVVNTPFGPYNKGDVITGAAVADILESGNASMVTKRAKQEHGTRSADAADKAEVA